MKVIKAILKNSIAQITAMALATVLMFGFVMYEMFNSILIVDPVLCKSRNRGTATGSD
ncbi:hypothetical protein J2Y03_000571 [Neobacillus niacini]|uniref:hypothetical protein n=1 Tax=Neobacillus niacini TaxID=86668 RepID=UPI00285FEAF9|nr:hypothetical protein [Neobacillus niacini]MDR7075583.1 hypothetical protein [Neobacillus niacini]